MNAIDLVKDLCAEIRNLTSDIDLLKYKNEEHKKTQEEVEETIKRLNNKITMLLKENEDLKKKIEDLEF